MLKQVLVHERLHLDLAQTLTSLAERAIGAAFHCHRQQVEHSVLVAAVALADWAMVLVGAVHCYLGAGYLGVSCTPEATH